MKIKKWLYDQHIELVGGVVVLVIIMLLSFCITERSKLLRQKQTEELKQLLQPHWEDISLQLKQIQKQIQELSKNGAMQPAPAVITPTRAPKYVDLEARLTNSVTTGSGTTLDERRRSYALERLQAGERMIVIGQENNNQYAGEYFFRAVQTLQIIKQPLYENLLTTAERSRLEAALKDALASSK